MEIKKGQIWHDKTRHSYFRILTNLNSDGEVDVQYFSPTGDVCKTKYQLLLQPEFYELIENFIFHFCTQSDCEGYWEDLCLDSNNENKDDFVPCEWGECKCPKFRKGISDAYLCEECE